MKLLKKILKHFIVKETRTINTPVLQGHFLDGKNALIIGGAGGIGTAITKAFYDNGCTIVISGTNSSRLEQICSNIGTDKVSYILLDLTQIQDIQQKVDEAAVILHNKIDILVNCAGVHGPADFWSVTEKDWDSVLNINVKGMFFCCQIVGKYMKENGIKGHILNISSASALKLGKTPYEISKNAIKSLTLGLASEMIKHGIVVNCLGPGPTATKMLHRGTEDPIDWPGNPAGRMATPEEIANWAVLLASSMGDYVVGDTLYVSGGSGTICIDR